MQAMIRVADPEFRRHHCRRRIPQLELFEIEFHLVPDVTAVTKRTEFMKNLNVRRFQGRHADRPEERLVAGGRRIC
jgi:hypothetical protein